MFSNPDFALKQTELILGRWSQLLYGNDPFGTTVAMFPLTAVSCFFFFLRRFELLFLSVLNED